MLKNNVIVVLVSIQSVFPVQNAMAQAGDPSQHPDMYLLDLAYEDVQPVNGKGGSDISGPYIPVRNWPQPLERGRMYGTTASIVAESPDSIIVAARSTKAPWPISYNWDMREAHPILAAEHLEGFRDKQHTHKFTVLDREGKIKEYWKQWDEAFPSIQFVRISQYDPDNHVYVTGRGQLMKFTRDGKRRLYTITSKDVPTNTGQSGFGPEGMSFHPDGSFWVASSDRIIRFSNDGKYLSEIGKAGNGQGELDRVHDVFFDPVGKRLYAADRSNHRIQIFDEDGRYIDQWPNIVGPSLVRMTADRQYIWVADLFTAKFLKFDLNGRLLTSWGTQGFGPGAITGGVHDFTTDSEGNLYIADHSNTVQKLRPREDGNPEQLIGRLLPY
jgi:DNA-binding beta-propeller fold protein YncE